MELCTGGELYHNIGQRAYSERTVSFVGFYCCLGSGYKCSAAADWTQWWPLGTYLDIAHVVSYVVVLVGLPGGINAALNKDFACALLHVANARLS